MWKRLAIWGPWVFCVLVFGFIGLTTFGTIGKRVVNGTTVSGTEVSCWAHTQINDKRGWRDIHWSRDDKTDKLTGIYIGSTFANSVQVRFVDHDVVTPDGCPDYEYQPLELPKNFDLRALKHDLYIKRESRAEDQLKERFRNTLAAFKRQPRLLQLVTPPT